MQPSIRDLITIVENTQKFVAYSRLPEDLQTWLFELIEEGGVVDPDDFDEDMLKRFPVTSVQVGALPAARINSPWARNPKPADQPNPGDERDQDYAKAINLKRAGPVVVAHGLLIDGKHRLFKAQQTGVEALRGIDISRWISPEVAKRIAIAPVSSEIKEDASGPNPLAGTFYHGTSTGKARSTTGLYVGNSPHWAAYYARNMVEPYGGKALILKGRVTAANPVVVSEDEIESLGYCDDLIRAYADQGYDAAMRQDGVEVFLFSHTSFVVESEELVDAEEVVEDDQTIVGATRGRMIDRKKAERITDPKGCFKPKAP